MAIRKPKTWFSQITKRTIAKELHAQWLRLRRRGDTIELSKRTGLTKAMIDRAVLYGHVLNQPLVDYITRFFADRLLREKELAQQIVDLKRQLKQK
jgi:hypothetical protein